MRCRSAGVLTPDRIRALMRLRPEDDVTTGTRNGFGGTVMKSEDRKIASGEAGKAAERRAFLKRFGGAAAAAPAAMLLLSAKRGMAFSNGGNKSRGGSAGAGFS